MMMVLASGAQAQVSGTVFRDYNANGIRDNTNELGVASLTVTAFYNGASSSVVSTTTGAYSFLAATIPSGTKVRLEFTGMATDDFSGPFAAATAGNGTSVQFVTAGAGLTTANFAVNMPIDYCQADPGLATSCFVNGATNAGGAADVLVSFGYANSGITPNPNHLALKSEIGSTWGLAYNRFTKKLYTSAFLKREVGVKDNDNDGIPDLGAIYVTNPATATNQVWADLAKAPYNLNVGSIGTDAARGLGEPNNTAIDADAFGKIGKVGLGDLEISDDASALWSVNLKTKTLHKIAINANGTAGAMTTLALPEPCGTVYTSLSINVGGTLQTNGFVTGWKADGYLVNTGSGTFASGQAGLPYSSGRFGAKLAYRIPVDNGSYVVTLFYGNNSTVRNQVSSVESTSLTQTIAANTSTLQTFTVTVTDGSLEVEATGIAPGNVAVLSGIQIVPTSGQTFSEKAPFALKYKNGAIYVGITCTAEYSQSKATDLTATVYRLPDDGSTTFTPVLTVPLNYTKQAPYFNCGVTGWFPWASTEQPIACPVYPQPMLSDIEFDTDGDMILGFIDRYAHQVAPGGFNLNGVGTNNAISGGDIRRANFVNGTYVNESSPGEFYNGEFFAENGTFLLTQRQPRVV